MKNSWFSYIKINEEDHCVNTSGITFNEFFEGIEEKPKNILILKGYPNCGDSHFESELRLDYIAFDKVKDFAKTDVYSYGDFYWLDFENINSLKSVSAFNLAEFLYFAHKAKPIKTFRFDCLNNQYAYCCHDDDWYVKIYMKQTESYKNVIEYKILKELKGKKRSISPLPQEIINCLYALFKEGGVIDFEYSYLTGVTIYPIGSIGSMDAIHKELDKLRPRAKGFHLNYNTDTKKWSMHERYS